MKGLLVVLAMVGGLHAAAGVCREGTPACQEKLLMGSPGRFVMVYRSHPLKAKNAKIKRALVVIHGAGRNADNYFLSGVAGAFLAGGLEDTLVVAPRFAGGGANNCKDLLTNGEIAFRCAGNDWRGGGPGVDEATVTTYDVIDKLVKHFADKKRYPNLKHVVLMGHSAGGQFLSRYAAAAKADPEGISVRYIVSNPSSYLYLDPSRPGPTAGCAAFDSWKYGMLKREGYAAPFSDDLMQKNLIRRDVVYLLGEYDITPQFGFDASCGAMAQGPNRLERGIAYHKYITTKYGAKHRVVKVPNCGHNGRCMLVADEAREVLFP